VYKIFLTDKDADVETDGISIISESEVNNDLEQPLSLAVSKEKKYLHHPNTYLNTRLNVLLALSFAAVTGLGLGHFLGNSALHIDSLCENSLYMHW
jgi:hypothetical protein